ncbi:class I ribonucleotide reductase maintenance protein YfaE [Oceanobacter mangrovi]|uniref:class I ribonucleotide reductase maintenance protein YfaE n=1 Tax=Oceanobacter mangrovi TaxID=2862510 RepID=UPI0031B9E4D8
MKALNKRREELPGQSASSNDNDWFELDGRSNDQPDFDLEPSSAESADEQRQAELYLPENDPEHPEPTPQLELDGMAPAIYSVMLSDGREARFQYANNLLESLEAQNIDVHFQCREGYCGSCRARLLSGEVHYTSEPMAWINDDEVLLCCCIPRGPIQLELLN